MFDPSKSQTIGSIASDDITFDVDGNFVVTIERGGARGGDWLPLHDDCVGLLVRTVHHDREVEATPVLRRSRVVDGDALRLVRPDEVANSLAKAAQMVLGFVQPLPRSGSTISPPHPNRLEFSAERYLTHGGVADREFAFGVWRKPADHALVVEFDTA